MEKLGDEFGASLQLRPGQVQPTVFVLVVGDSASANCVGRKWELTWKELMGQLGDG